MASWLNSRVMELYVLKHIIGLCEFILVVSVVDDVEG